jgi:myo-inositol-1(or 4)-monophosphatase
MTVAADLLERFALAQAIAREAGALALAHFKARDKLNIETKANAQDVVSIADRETEDLIRGRVSEAFSNDGVLGEEYGLSDGTSGWTWVVDPIDGTSPFVFGMPNWCVSTALLHDDKLVGGVVYAPVTDELFAAANGQGATLNGTPIRVNPDHRLTNTMTGIGSNHLADPVVVGKICENLLAQGGNFFRNGSGALMLAYVAAGRLGGYFEPFMNAWDCLGGYCIIAEAGGVHRDFEIAGGKLLTPQPVFAAAPGVEKALRVLVGV